MNDPFASRQMTPEELVQHGYPADLFTRPGAYAEYQESKLQEALKTDEVRGYGLRAQDFNGHVPQKPVKQSRDRAQYVRQQKGHSLTLHLLLGAFVLWIPAIYYSFSPNHYWHV